ncbi:MAG: ABC transporter substrate-binding protein, partial [Mariniphaga sp.]
MNSLTYFSNKIGLFIQLFLLLYAIPSNAQEKVTLQLKWTHAFQFAGYYAAKEQGYYSEAGLDVNILEAGPDTDPVNEVVQNKAQYGVGSSGLLLARSSGKPVVVLAVIFQQSPYEIYAAPEIHHLRDLVGKRLMLEPQSEELIAFLKKEGIPMDSIQMVPHSFSADGLIQCKTEAMSGYLSSEPYYFRQINFPYQTFSPRSAGIDFYGDNLFTSEKELVNHSDRVKAFRAASLRGWQYAKDNRDRVIEMIFSKYSKVHSTDYLHFESDQMIPLLQPDLIDIGYMNLNRWQHIADTYSSIGLLQTGYSLNGFMFDSNEKSMKWYFRILGFAGSIIVIISIIAFYIYRVNQKLAKSIFLVNQTKAALQESEELWHTIVRTSPDGIAITNLDGTFIQASDKMVRMLGYNSLEELMGINIYGFVEPSYQTKAQKRRENTLNGDKLDPEIFILIRKDGNQFFVESNVAVIYDKYGKARNLFFIERDITERIKAEKSLSENEQSYFDLFNSVSEAIYIQDKQGIFLDVNRGVENMYGYTREELIGKSPEFLSAHEKNNLEEIT